MKNQMNSTPQFLYLLTYELLYVLGLLQCRSPIGASSLSIFTQLTGTRGFRPSSALSSTSHNAVEIPAASFRTPTLIQLQTYIFIRFDRKFTTHLQL